jgi:hypothetical protein
LHRLEHVPLGGNIEAGSGFIKDDNGRSASEGHRKRHTLLLSSGELMWVPSQNVGGRVQAHVVQQFNYSLLSISY